MDARRTAVSLAIALGMGSVALAQETLRVSVDSSGAQGNDTSWVPAISADGQIVAFEGYASNLVSFDTNGTSDVFVHDRTTGVSERVSVDSSGAQANDASGYAAISADGLVVAFQSHATNLVAGDTNGAWDIFVHDRSTGITGRVSLDSSGAQGNGDSNDPRLSSDGRLVVFHSFARNLVAGDTNTASDIFVHDRATGVTERVSVDSSGSEGNRGSAYASISADGRIVAFQSNASNLVAGDTNGRPDIFVHDRSTGLTERDSVDSSGVQGNLTSSFPALSADGLTVAFESSATNLVAGDTNGDSDVFLHDRSTGLTERVSVDSSGVEGNRGSLSAAVSSDGRIAAFTSLATNLVVGDTNGKYDVFVHNRSSGLTERVSVDTAGAEGDGDSWDEVISADGQVLAFQSWATNLVPGDSNGKPDVFVRAFCSTVASWSNYGAGLPGTTGVPSFTAQSNPVLGSTIVLDLANSFANPTVGLVFVGTQRASIPSVWGADLLVDPSLVLPVTFSYGSVSLTGNIPDDRSLCGVAYDLQAIETDPGAAHGVSFTPGLELVVGN